MRKIMEQNSFTIRFDGQEHQIDANVLISSLVNTTTIIQETNTYLNTGKKIQIKVTAPEKGSFLINLEIVESVLDNLLGLFNKENVILASSILSAVASFIQIKKHLKNKKPKQIVEKGDKQIIINSEDSSLEVKKEMFKIFSTSPVIDTALSQTFSALENEPAVDAFEIIDYKQEPVFRIERENFVDLSYNTIIVEDRTRTLQEVAFLNIIRLSFETNVKWDFYYRGSKISAKILDPNFYEMINKGESFAKGDILEVDLQINQLFDETVNTYVNKSYQINRIIKHITRAEQLIIPFEKN